MSQFFDQASLVMVPSGYKDGKVYSQKPLSTDGELTFSRGSDIEATRVASNGYIQKAAVNLLLQSNSFDTGWTLTSGSSVTSGQSGYDGSSDAWLLTDSGNNSAYCVYRGYTNTGVQTFSIYAKQASTSQIEFDFLGGGGGYLRAELTDGSLHSTLDTIDYKIEDAGGGWWRCSFSTNHTSAPILVRIGCNGAGSIYIQDAQLNYGLVAQEYQETTTTSVVSGITNDMPRLDYSGSCPSLLLEPSRTNQMTHSEYFGAWTPSATTIVSNASTSPEGVENASLIYPSVASASLTGVYLLTSKNTTATLSCFVKSAGKRYAFLGSDNSISYACVFDLTTGEVVSEAVDYTASIQDYGSGWYRITASYINSRALNYPFVGVGDAADGSVSISGTDGLYIYGFQYEHSSSHATSLIPTYGTSATRTKDLCSKTGISSLIGQTEGTLFFEFEVDHPSTGNQLFSLDNGTIDDRIEIYASGAGAQLGKIGVYVERGSPQVAHTTNVDSQGRHKIALAYKLNDYALYIDGVLKHTDTSALVPACDIVRLVGRYDNFNEGKQSTKQALLFKTRLSNSDLATLTSL
jgi:hypothetical protein